MNKTISFPQVAEQTIYFPLFAEQSNSTSMQIIGLLNISNNKSK